MILNAAVRLTADSMQKSWAQKFQPGSKVVIVDSFVFDDGKRSKRMMPGTVVSVGNSGTKERGVPGVQRFCYVVRTPFGEHTFEQDDLKAQ
jgi:hypothetical protein